MAKRARRGPQDPAEDHESCGWQGWGDARAEEKAGEKHAPHANICDSLRTCQEKKHPEGIVAQSTSRKDADIGEGGSARPKPCGVAKHALGEGKNDAA